mgnify:CR=1 FL=1
MPRKARILIVEPGEDANVSELMKRLEGRQVAFVNKQEDRSGAGRQIGFVPWVS